MSRMGQISPLREVGIMQIERANRTCFILPIRSEFSKLKISTNREYKVQLGEREQLDALLAQPSRPDDPCTLENLCCCRGEKGPK